MILILMYELFKNKDLEIIKQHTIVSIISLSFISIIIFLPLIRTIASGETYGGKTGLFSDCVVNYINQYIHHNPKIDRNKMIPPELKLTQILGFITFCYGSHFKPTASYAKVTNWQIKCIYKHFY